MLRIKLEQNSTRLLLIDDDDSLWNSEELHEPFRWKWYISTVYPIRIFFPIYVQSQDSRSVIRRFVHNKPVCGKDYVIDMKDKSYQTATQE